MPSKRGVEIPAPDSEIRILLVRLGAIGDVLMTSPVAQALREAFPRAHLCWVVEPLSASLVRANPFVDEVIVIDRMPVWERLLREAKIVPFLREVHAFAQALRARKFDIAIDFQGLLKSGLVSYLSGAPRRVGFTPSREGNRFFLTESLERPPHPTRITQAYLALLNTVGIASSPRRPVLAIPEQERVQALDFLAARGLVGESYVACCVSTSRLQKDWVWQRWAELADLFWTRERLRTVFIGGPERRCDTLSLLEGCTSRPISAVGHTSLLQSAAIVQHAALVVGGDTGVTYAGLATDTPTVALYGSTDPTWLAEEAFAAVCFHPMPCSPCIRRPKCKAYDCMQAITVEEVYTTGMRLLERVRVPA